MALLLTGTVSSPWWTCRVEEWLFLTCNRVLSLHQATPCDNGRKHLNDLKWLNTNSRIQKIYQNVQQKRCRYKQSWMMCSKVSEVIKNIILELKCFNTWVFFSFLLLLEITNLFLKTAVIRWCALTSLSILIYLLMYLFLPSHFMCL